MIKLKKGLKTEFVLKLLMSNVEITQLSLAKYAKDFNDPRLYSTRLSGIIYELRKKHVIETIMEENSCSFGRYAVYKYIGKKPEEEPVKSLSQRILGIFSLWKH